MQAGSLAAEISPVNGGLRRISRGAEATPLASASLATPLLTVERRDGSVIESGSVVQVTRTASATLVEMRAPGLKAAAKWIEDPGAGEMRLLVYELRPAMVEEVGLAGALRQRLEAVEQRSGVRVQLTADDDHAIPLAMQNELFRVAEEALNNALRHAAATSVAVRLKADGQGLELDVKDDGGGFDVAAAADRGGLGLASMRERAEALGGRLEIVSHPGAGTTVKVRVERWEGL